MSQPTPSSNTLPTDDAGNPMAPDCPGREVFNHVTSRWAMLVLVSLRDGPQRFYRLRDGVGGISEKMLSQTLKTLARDGLVYRQAEPTVPPQVSYQLTPLGVSLVAQLRGLIGWIGAHIEAVQSAQHAYDHAPMAASGQALPLPSRASAAAQDNALFWPSHRAT